MGQRRNWKLLSTGRRRIARPGKTPRPASSRSASGKPSGWDSDLRRIHAGNSRTRPSPADRGCRTDCRDQAGARCSTPIESTRKLSSPEPIILMPNIQIRALQSSPDIRAMLSEMLIEAVANGGSVSFMHPLSRQAAEAFWANSLGAADRGERIVLGAFDGDRADRHRDAAARSSAEPAASRRDREDDDAPQSPPPRHRHGAVARGRAAGDRARALATGARYRRGRRRGRTLRADGIQARPA